MVGDPGQHLRAQVPKAPVSEHDDPIVPADRELRWDLKGGGHRFREYRDVVRQVIRDDVEILLRNGNEICEGSVVIEDTQHAASGAVRRESAQARLAAPAAAVDLADNAPTLEGTGARDTNELVSEHPRKSHVPLHELEVRLADARQRHAHEHFGGARKGLGLPGIKADAVSQH
jgi:hypothetical protein